MLQVGRELTNPLDGFLRGKKFLIMDRDGKHPESFRRLLANAGVEPVVIARRAPNQNAHAERTVRSIKEECLAKLIFIAARSLRPAIREYLAHCHAERSRQGLGNRLIEPERNLGGRTGRVLCRQRLGGLLKHYYRVAA